MPNLSNVSFWSNVKHLVVHFARHWIWVTAITAVSIVLLHQFFIAETNRIAVAESHNIEAAVTEPPYFLDNWKLGIQRSYYEIPEKAFFVSPQGDETNLGTDINSPWPLAKALKDAPNGATIVLKGGTYRTGLRKPENGGQEVNETLINKAFTIQPYEDETPILKGSLVIDDWVRDGNAWKAQWIYHFPAGDSQAATEENPMAAHCDGVWIDEEPLWQVQSRNQVERGTFYLDYETNSLYIGTNPEGRIVEATAFSRGFNNWQMPDPGLTIRGLTFKHYANTAIYLDCPDIVIENNQFIQNRHTGLFVGNTGVKQFESYGVGAIVRHNVFLSNGTQAVGAVRGHRLLLEGNIIKGNNTKIADHSAGGVKFVFSDGIIARYNWFANNIGFGIWFDVGSSGARLVKNVIQNNNGAIFWEISDGAIIAGNLIFNNNTAVSISGSINVFIYNNTFHDNRTAIFAPDPDRRDTHRGPGYTENIVVENNIFSASDRQDASRFLVFKTGICEQPLVSNLNNNAYYRRDLRQPEGLIEWEAYPYADDCQRVRSGTVYSSLDAFRRDTGFETDGLEASGSSSSFYMDASADNYRLRDDAPVVKAGSPLPPEIADALDWPDAQSVDLGAYQVLSGSL